MKNSILILFVITTLLSSCSKDEDAFMAQELSCPELGLGTAHPNAVEYQSILDELIDNGYPGVSATIEDKHGLWLGTSGMADISNDIAMQTCHVSHSGSYAKMYTTTAAMILYEMGMLDLDDKIEKWIPKRLSEGLPNGQTATIRQLMNHSAGMPDHDDDEELSKYGDRNDQHLPPAVDQLAYLFDDEARFPAGSSSEYSSAHTLTLSLVLDSISGSHHSHIITDYIINHLSLTNTFYKNELGYPAPPNLAKGYWNRKKDVTQEGINYAGDSQGDAGVIASSHDYYLFLKALMEGDIISQSTLDEMLDPFWWIEFGTGSGIGVGLGPFMIKTENKLAKIGHGGVTIGGMTHVYYYPEHNAYISLFTNTITVEKLDLFDHWVGDVIPDINGTSIIERIEKIILNE